MIASVARQRDLKQRDQLAKITMHPASATTIASINNGKTGSANTTGIFRPHSHKVQLTDFAGCRSCASAPCMANSSLSTDIPLLPMADVAKVCNQIVHRKVYSYSSPHTVST
eukprot:1365608-Amphidinium_carterae.1